MRYSRWHQNGVLWTAVSVVLAVALVAAEQWATTRSDRPLVVNITAVETQEDESGEATETVARQRYGTVDILRVEAERQMADPQAPAERLFEQARHARAFKDYALADRLLARSLELDPKHVEALFLRGRTLSDLGNVSEAERLYREVLARAPNHQKATYNLALLLGRAGKTAEAEVLFRRAVDITSGRLKAKALHQLGMVLGTQSRWVDASEAFRRATELRPQYHHYWLALGEVLQTQGRTAEALAALENAQALRKSSADVQLALARLYQERGSRAKALRHLQRAVRLDPAKPEARGELGNLYFARGELQKAQEQYRWLLDNARDEADRAYYEGMLLLKQDPARALKRLKEADRRRPGHYDRALERLAVALHDSKQYEEAWALLQTLMSRSADSPSLLTAAGRTALRLEKWHEAGTLLRRSLVLRPRSADTLFLLARVHSEQGRAEDAIASYRQSLALDPDARATRLNLAVLLARSGRDVDALRLYNELLRDHPRYLPALVNRARLHERAKRRSEAVADLEQALRIDADNTDVRLQLATLLLAGQPERARDILAEAVAEAPDSIDARLLLAQAERALGRPDDALKQLKRAAALGTKDTRPWLSLAQLHVDRGQLDAAVEAVGNAVARDSAAIDAASVICQRVRHIRAPKPARRCYQYLHGANQDPSRSADESREAGQAGSQQPGQPPTAVQPDPSDKEPPDVSETP